MDPIKSPQIPSNNNDNIEEKNEILNFIKELETKQEPLNEEIENSVNYIISSDDKKTALKEVIHAILLNEEVEGLSEEVEKLFDTTIPAGAEITSKVSAFCKTVTLLGQFSKHSEFFEIFAELKEVFFETSEVLECAVNLYEIISLGEKIEKLQEESESLLNQIESEESPALKKELEKTLILNDKVLTLYSEKYKTTINSFCYFSLKTLLSTTGTAAKVSSDYLAACSQTSSSLIKELSVTASTTSLLTSIIAATYFSYNTYKEYDKIEALTNEIQKLNQEMEKSSDHSIQLILKFRIDHLKQVKKEAIIDATQSFAFATSSGLSTSLAIKSLATSAGYALGPSTSTALLSAAVIGSTVSGTAVAAGVVYTGYQNRNKVGYYSSYLIQSVHRYQINTKLESEKKVKKQALETLEDIELFFTLFSEAEKVYKDYKDTEMSQQATDQLKPYVERWDSALMNQFNANTILKETDKKIGNLELKLQEIDNNISTLKTDYIFKKNCSLFNNLGNLDAQIVLKNVLQDVLENDKDRKKIEDFLKDHDYHSSEEIGYNKVFDFIIS